MTIEYGGDVYNDDRMFVMSICKCIVETAEDGAVKTTVYHENIPSEYKWCLVTYRNTARYPAVRVDNYDRLDQAQAYMRSVEPTVPRISLGGRPPRAPVSYDEFVRWKTENNLMEYDYKKMYMPGGSNHSETFISFPR
jgi:hypothetical protein